MIWRAFLRDCLWLQTQQAGLTITFTVTIQQQSRTPVALNSPIYTDLPCIAEARVGGCNCIFPFTYNGHTYNQCTGVEETSPWCALETGDDGSFEPHRNDWSFCDSPTTCH